MRAAEHPEAKAAGFHAGAQHWNYTPAMVVTRARDSAVRGTMIVIVRGRVMVVVSPTG